ncbi:MAG: HesB/IscA family protein, partial [Dehalococcoidia bacterium]
DKLKVILQEQGTEGTALRVLAVPGEQGGVQYMLSMEKEPQDDDQVIQADGLQVLVDSFSAPFLEEATIDYIEDLMRAGFVISNPKYAGSGCACGGHCSCGGH